MVVLLFRYRVNVELLSRSYGEFLLVPWRMTTFIIALLGIYVIAPYTGDPTWDYIDALVIYKC